MTARHAAECIQEDRIQDIVSEVSGVVHTVQGLRRDRAWIKGIGALLLGQILILAAALIQWYALTRESARDIAHLAEVARGHEERLYKSERALSEMSGDVREIRAILTTFTGDYAAYRKGVDKPDTKEGH